jgi:hypothetical protein
MKNILTGRIDHLNFDEDGETVRSTRVICATRSTVAKLYIYIESFNLNMSKDSSYYNIVDYQFSSYLKLVYYA